MFLLAFSRFSAIVIQYFVYFTIFFFLKIKKRKRANITKACFDYIHLSIQIWHCNAYAQVDGNCQRSENIPTSGNKFGWEKKTTKLCQVKIWLCSLVLFCHALPCLDEKDFFLFGIEIFVSCSPQRVWVFFLVYQNEDVMELVRFLV